MHVGIGVNDQRSQVPADLEHDELRMLACGVVLERVLVREPVVVGAGVRMIVGVRHGVPPKKPLPGTRRDARQQRFLD